MSGIRHFDYVTDFLKITICNLFIYLHAFACSHTRTTSTRTDHGAVNDIAAGKRREGSTSVKLTTQPRTVGDGPVGNLTAESLPSRPRSPFCFDPDGAMDNR